jgi:hypothetical protein
MKTHNFHFLITEELKEKTNNINELKKYSFSKKINFILDKISNIPILLDKLKLNEKSKVEYLKNKKNVHLYIKEKLYKKIKYLHGYFNTYSLALYVRMVIRIFIRMVEKYGFEKALEEIEKQIKILKKINKTKNKKLIIVQLYNYLGLKLNKNQKLELILVKLLL